MFQTCLLFRFLLDDVFKSSVPLVLVGSVDCSCNKIKGEYSELVGCFGLLYCTCLLGFSENVVIKKKGGGYKCNLLERVFFCAGYCR